MEQIRLAAPLNADSIVDGPGLRIVVWTQGCNHNCKGCHNPSTHDFEGGALFDIKDILKELDKLKYHNGITFSGGDPMYQPRACSIIAKHAKENNMDVWCYTGFTFEQLLKQNNKDINEFLKYIDVLVDGPFILSKRNLDLLFRGSSNQRLIEVKKSLKENKIILLDEDNYNMENLSGKEFNKNQLFI